MHTTPARKPTHQTSGEPPLKKLSADILALGGGSKRRAEMSGPQTSELGLRLLRCLKDLSILQALHELPAGVALTTTEAAIFLRMSPATLERMRRPGGGPAYIQGGGKGAKGTNQKVTYLKEDLIAYQSKMKVTSSMVAAVRKGQTQGYLAYIDPTPKRSRFDMVTKRAFYVHGGFLSSPVDEAPIHVVIQGLGTAAYVWHSPVKAAALGWVSSSSKERFASEVREALTLAMERVGCAGAGAGAGATAM